MNRIEMLRKKIGKSMAQVAKELNIPYTTYVNYEKGTREPNSEMLIILADYYGVSIDFLLNRSELSSFFVNSYSDEEKQLVANYRTLDDIDKAEIRGEIKHMLKANKYKTSSGFDIAEDIINEIKQVTAPMQNVQHTK